ncbi:MAG: TM2 domain-containing protein [Bacteroidales bacterium]|nr:TM2 domain-containing protein [Bacteroidales bacterium]
MNTLLKYLPEVEGDEMFYLNDLLKNYTEDQIRDFSFMYRSRRRDPKIILLTTLLGFLGFAGIQRFLTDQIGMGILYFFTAGLCFIGTIVDLVNYRNIAFTYNQRVAYEVVTIFGK